MIKNKKTILTRKGKLELLRRLKKGCYNQIKFNNMQINIWNETGRTRINEGEQAIACICFRNVKTYRKFNVLHKKEIRKYDREIFETNLSIRTGRRD
jgi:biotin synthase-related radical SAM superfamily protein